MVLQSRWRSPWVPSLFLLAAVLVVGGCGDEGPQAPSEENASDGEPPTVASAGLSAERVWTSPLGPSRVDAEVTARDPSGVSLVVVHLTAAEGTTRTCAAALVEGTAEEGTWRCALVLSLSDPEGDWSGRVVLQDAEGNEGEHAIPRGVEVITDPDDDLSIRYIQRLPEIDYVWESPDPTRDGWPAPGQEVRWSAHLFNGSVRPRPAVAYRWLLDDAVVEEGQVDLPPGGEAVVEYPWSWTFQRQRLRLELDTSDDFPELSEENNELEIFTDALSVGFYVERSVWEYFLQHQRELGVGAVTWEDWAHRHIDRFNAILRDAVYAETPSGVLDRVRLDRVTVVDDDALPLAPLDSIDQPDKGPSLMPNIEDRTVDMQWGFIEELVDLYDDTQTPVEHNPFYLTGSLLHELGHARYLTDVYGFDVFHGVRGDTVEIVEGGEPLVGSRYMPGETIISNGQPGLVVHRTGEEGLMVYDYDKVDRHSAIALNLIAGRRAVTGNYNEPRNLAVYLNDLPARNVLLLVDTQGNPLDGAELRVYQAVGRPGIEAWYARRFDDLPDIVRTADSTGRVELPQNPFGGDAVRHWWEVSNAVAILRVEHGGRVGYEFLEVSQLNLEYWRGNSDLAEYAVAVDLLEP